MIKVTIEDQDTGMEKDLHFPVGSLKKDRYATTAFFHRIDQMIGEFLRDLREQWKEEKP